MRTILFRKGGYQVVIDTDSLRDIPKANFRKILTLARSESRNEAALQELRQILLERVNEAEKAYTKAKEEFCVGWKWVNKKSRTEASLVILRKNAILHNAVKRAKADLSAANALWKIFTEKETN